MRKLLGHLALCAALGVLLVTTVGNQARGGPIEMEVTIFDVSTATTVLPTTPILKAGPFDASNLGDPNSLITNGTFDTLTTAVGLQLQGLTALSNNPGSLTSATLSVGGTAQVVPGVASSDDTFKVTILVSQTFFTNPPGPAPRWAIPRRIPSPIRPDIRGTRKPSRASTTRRIRSLVRGWARPARPGSRWLCPQTRGPRRPARPRMARRPASRRT